MQYDASYPVYVMGGGCTKVKQVRPKSASSIPCSHTIRSSFCINNTQGTIVEWTAQVGQAVKDGDVVAMVETDKVTVEIKAEMDGVVTQQFGDM